MFLYPNAKINIGLNIINKLKSGYHEIESCFCPVSLCDIIEVNTYDKNHLTTSGIEINSDISDNILIKCLKKFNSINKYRIHLHKKIPVGAGLGGGSSDAAFFLNFLNNNTQGKLTNKQLFQVANEIGSDCPFFLENKKKYVTGTGNILNEIKIDIKNKFILIVDPVNGNLVNIPSYTLKEGDMIAVRERSKSLVAISESVSNKTANKYKWLEWDDKSLLGKLVTYPDREAIPENINEQLIVELYSK